MNYHMNLIIMKLQLIGYKIFCVVDDNDALNTKARNNFSLQKDRVVHLSCLLNYELYLKSWRKMFQI